MKHVLGVALAVCSLGILSCSAPALAQSRWSVDATPKRALPAHLADWRDLPAGSVTTLARVAGKADGDWWLPLPDGGRLRVAHRQRVDHANGDVTWSGTIDGAGAAYPVIVTEGADAAFGEWTTPRGRFRFESWGGQGWLLDLDHPQLREASFDAGDGVVPPRSLRSKRDAATARAAPATTAAASAPKAGETIIDVLFVYSPGFATRYPGTATQTRVSFLVALANQLFINSDVDLLLRVVGVDPVSYNDSNDNSIALNELRLATDASNTQVAGLSGLRARRLQTGADLVTLARPHDNEVRGSCGIAYLFGQGAGFGVNVLSDGFSSWSICSNETYAHEVGHNLGAEHQNGSNSPNAGFGTAHIALGRFHTVMGSFGTGSPNRALRLRRFSNPQQLCGGRPCGEVGVSDNARRLRDNLAAVAGYMASASAAPPPQRPLAEDPDDDGDGVPESADAFPHDPAFSSDRDLDGVADQLDAFPDDSLESIDTDADGIGNNADPDRDNDGVANALDALPLDPTETVDSDGDGVGNNADRFDADRREWADLDGDGIGDNADTDTDGDGLADYAAAQDLLVTSVGSDRVLRFDGETGTFIAVEIAEQHLPLALGPRGTVAWNPYRKRVDALVASEIRRYLPASRQREARVLRAFRDGVSPGLRSGLSSSFALGADGRIYVADGANNSLQRYDAVTAALLDGGQFSDTPSTGNAVRAMLHVSPNRLWVLDMAANLREIDSDSGALVRQVSLRGGGVNGPTDPTGIALGPDGALYVTDAATDRVLRVDVQANFALSVLVPRTSGALNAPIGLTFDAEGRLLVASSATSKVHRFDGSSGALLGEFAIAPAGVLSEPHALRTVPKVLDRYPRDASRRHRPRVGAWLNPANSGQGLDIQAIPGGLAVGWYTYDADGKATWYLAVGALDGDRLDAPLLRYRWDGSAATGTEVGSLSLAFSADDRATFAWQLDGRSGSESVRHLQAGNSVETQFPTGDWFAPTSSGWGYAITKQGDVLAIAAFFFDRAGEPSWALGVDSAQATEVSMIRYSAPGGCPGCVGNTSPQTREIGTVDFEVIDDLRASGAIELLDDDIDWRFPQLDLQRISETPTAVNGDPRP